MPTRRNFAACASIMRKGGVHQRTRSGERHHERLQLNEWLLEGLEEYFELQHTVENKDVLPDPSSCNITLTSPANLLLSC